MAVVACLHLFMVNTVSMTPWKGGGFAMFSTADTVGNRFVRVDAQFAPGTDVPATAVRVAVPKEPRVKRAERRAQATPTEQKAMELAAELGVLDWYLVDPGAPPPDPNTAREVQGASGALDSDEGDVPSSLAHQVMALRPEHAKLLRAKRVDPLSISVDVRRIVWDWTSPGVSSESLLKVTMDLPKRGG
jgi:hypothetical protein